MKQIGVDTKLAAIIGTDIGHSKSSAMMNAAFQELGLNYYYFPMNIRQEDFGDVIRGISKMNFAGLTITIPYKLEILRYLDAIDPLAEVIGAVNTVKIENGKLTGFNTDGAGFVRGLEADLGLSISEEAFLVVGAGGVARAISTVLASRKPRKLILANRTVKKAEEICEKLNRQVWNGCEAISLEEIRSRLQEVTVVINATNIGMAPREDGCLIQDPSVFHKDLVVSDIIYNPRQTKLMAMAKSQGCPVFNGLYMLLYQGAESFRLWTGQDMPVAVIREKFFT